MCAPRIGGLGINPSGGKGEALWRWFPVWKRLVAKEAGSRPQFTRKTGVKGAMDPMINIPPNRRKPRPFRLVLLLGLTVLLFALIVNR